MTKPSKWRIIYYRKGEKTMTNKQLIHILKRFKPSASVKMVSPDGKQSDPSITASLNESGEWLIQIRTSTSMPKRVVEQQQNEKQKGK